MKRLIRNTVLFVLVAIPAYLLLLCLLGDWGWVRTARTDMGNRGFLNTRIKDIRNYHNVDSVVSTWAPPTKLPSRLLSSSRPISTASTPASSSSKSTPTS